MKKIILLFAVASSMTLFSCGGGENHESNESDSTKAETPNEEVKKYGDTTITEDGAVEMSELLTMMEGKDSLAVKLTGVVEDVCQKKGCWMTMDMGNGNSMRVTFKDYGFFMPKNASGMTAVMNGKVKVDTLTVEMQKHYLEDDNAPQEEIDAVTEPVAEWSFEADGVILKAKKD